MSVQANLITPPSSRVSVPAGAPRQFLQACMGDLASGPRQVVVTLPAPLGPADAALRGVPRDGVIFFQPPTGPSLAGFGVADRVVAKTEEDMAALQQRAQTRLNTSARRTFSGTPAFEPRYFGGMSFDGERAQDHLWEQFPGLMFVLPRFLYVRELRDARLVVVLDQAQSGDHHQQILHEYDRLMERLVSPSPLPGLPSLEKSEQASREDWDGYLKEVLGAISQDAVQKVVAAVHSRLTFSAPVSFEAVLHRLCKPGDQGTCFAIGSRQSVFLGRTPERLVKKKGRQVDSAAVAGTTHARDASSLLRREKDRREHDLVLDFVLQRLRPICSALDFSSEPNVHHFGTVAHLLTALSGTLKEPAHILALVSLLHPTPAVGGVPARTALSLIRQNESFCRRWYAAPVVWFDTQGDGEFFVALRSGLLRDRFADLYAGAGIVAGADPSLEYEETQLKQQSLMQALGI